MKRNVIRGVGEKELLQIEPDPFVLCYAMVSAVSAKGPMASCRLPVQATMFCGTVQACC